MDAPDLEQLARRLAALERELQLEGQSLDAAHAHLRSLRGQCEALARAIESARKAPPAPAPPIAAEPAASPTPSAAALDLDRPGVAVASEPAPAPMAIPVEPIESVEAIPKHAAILTPIEETPPPLPPVAPAPALSRFGNLETLIGAYWLGPLGAISLLVGFVLLAGHIQPHMTPAMRVALGYLAAAVLCGVGVWFEKAYPKFARPILAAGMILAFFISFAGHFIPPTHCFSLGVSTALMLVMAGGVVLAAGLYRSQALAVLALAMGFWVALFATELTPAFTPIMLVFLAAAGAALFLRFGWTVLLLLAVAGVYLSHLWWMNFGEKWLMPRTNFWVELEYLTAYFAVFLAGDLVHRWRGKSGTGSRSFLDQCLSPISAPSEWEGFLPSSQVILAARFLNPILYFMLGTLAFHTTRLYWDNIHYFYWPLGAALAAIGIAVRQIERGASRDDDVYYVLSSGLITLGFASAFDAMQLSNVLALEGLCLFAIRYITGRPIFQYLSAAHFVIAFCHFNFETFAQLRFAKETHWRAFGAGLPVVLFTLAPAFLAPYWKGRRGEAAATEPSPPSPGLLPRLPELDERFIAHARMFGASLLLLRLFAETVRSETTYGLWILLIPIALGAAWAVKPIPSLWTLAGTFFAWAQLYFCLQLERIKWGDPAWIFPAALAMTWLTLAAGVLVEKATRRQFPRWEEAQRGALERWLALLALLAVVSYLDITALLDKRANELHHFALAGALAMVLFLVAAATQITFFCLTGLLLIVMFAWFQMNYLVGSRARIPWFFHWTAIGTALVVVFERCYYFRAAQLFEKAYDVFRQGRIVLVALATAVLLLAINRTPWIGIRYETVGVTVVAVALLVLGIAFQSATYRRFGLGVFVYALARVYLVDLRDLETVYKIIAFIVLGVVLIGVSYLYTRFKEQFQRWV